LGNGCAAVLGGDWSNWWEGVFGVRLPEKRSEKAIRGGAGCHESQLRPTARERGKDARQRALATKRGSGMSPNCPPASNFNPFQSVALGMFIA